MPNDNRLSEKRAALAAGFEHSVWQLVEHLRLAQAEMLDFCVNQAYVHSMKWPDDYWPSPTPQTHLRALLLVADHNSYHVGQIVAVRRALGAWSG